MNTPSKILEQLKGDPFMYFCIHTLFQKDSHLCRGKVEWHHALIFSGRQIQEAWAIVPLCQYHHKQPNKDFARHLAFCRAEHMGIDLTKLTDFNHWKHEIKRLKSLYVDFDINYWTRKAEQLYIGG